MSTSGDSDIELPASQLYSGPSLLAVASRLSQDLLFVTYVDGMQPVVLHMQRRPHEVRSKLQAERGRLECPRHPRPPGWDEGVKHVLKTTLRPCDHYGDGLQADVGFSVLCTVWLKKRTNSVVPALEKYFPS